MLRTTLNEIRKHAPCTEGWRKLLSNLGKTKDDNEPLSLLWILRSNGIEDALWCLRCWPEYDSIWRLLAVRYARDVQHLMVDQRSLNALEVSENNAHGMATDEELAAAMAAARAAAWAAARDAAMDAAMDAAWAAAMDAAWAAAMDAAGDAAWAAAMDAARAAAWAAAMDAAGDAARDAARERQKWQFIDAIRIAGRIECHKMDDEEEAHR